jgi:MFS family permease
MVLLGLSFTLVPAAMWPAVPRIVDENRVGAAYGIMTWIQSLGLLLFPLLAGWITDATNRGVTTEMLESGSGNLDYTYTTLMFALLAIFGLIFAFFLKREDSRNLAGILEKPERSE